MNLEVKRFDSKPKRELSNFCDFVKLYAKARTLVKLPKSIRSNKGIIQDDQYTYAQNDLLVNYVIAYVNPLSLLNNKLYKSS